MIPIDTTDAGEQVVLGRDLWEFLEVSRHYTTWFDRMKTYGFEQGVDFYPVRGETSEQGGRPRTDHILTLNMAKELSMIQRTERGILPLTWHFTLKDE
ncbi:MAG: antA/AntB antirepressor family protein [Corynebacterium variabile]|uniref:antA/AntB antirepressor family protein n=1 Tax=Corynebacterium variabile TaxID=1727 RepID=UPI003BB7DAD6